jgi:DNA topoisomerase-3
MYKPRVYSEYFRYKYNYFKIKNKEMLVFMVAEKPSLAQSISKILSNNQATSRKGFNGACSVHEWNGRFQNMNCHFRMTSVCGHIMGLDFTSKYNNWDKVDPVSWLFIAE